MKMINKIIIGVAMLLQLAHATTYDSIYKAIPAAQQQNKFVVFFILQTGCPHCSELMNDISNNQELTNLLENKYVVAITDLVRGGKVPADLPFNGQTPTIMVVTPNGKLIGNPIEGKVPSNMLLEYLTKLDKLKQSYEESGAM